MTLLTDFFFKNSLDSKKAQVREQVRHNLVLETQVLAETKLKETEDKIKHIELAEKEDDIRMKRIEKVMELKNRGMTAASIKFFSRILQRLLLLFFKTTLKKL
jgi:predicted Holliday junction resolvase-like endonuclease